MRAYWDDFWTHDEPLLPALTMVCDEDVAHSGLYDVKGRPLVYPRQTLGFINFAALAKRTTEDGTKS